MNLAIRFTYQIGWLLIVCTHRAFKGMYESKFIYREISMNNEQMKQYCGENRLVIPACIHTRAHTTTTAAICNANGHISKRMAFSLITVKSLPL